MHIRITGFRSITAFSPLWQIFHHLEQSLVDRYLRSPRLHIILVHIHHHLQEEDKALLILHLPQHAQLVLLLI